MSNFLEIMQNGIEKELPSGLVVRLRPVDAGILLSKKGIPDNLMAVVKKQIVGIEKGQDQEQVAKEQASATINEGEDSVVALYTDIRLYGEAVARCAVVYPKIVDDPQGKDEMSIDWFETNDLIALGGIVGMPLRELESFRFRQNNDVEPVQPLEGNLPDSESGDELGELVEESDAGELDNSELVGDVPVRRRRNKIRDLDREPTESN